MPLCIECMCLNEGKTQNKWGKHYKLMTMKGICCYVKLTKIKHKILNPEICWEGGGAVKRPAPSLGPPFVINISFRHLELLCLFYVLNVAPSVLLIQEYRLAAILKKWRTFPNFRWLTCFFDKKKKYPEMFLTKHACITN